MGYHDYLDLTEEFKSEDFPVAGLNDSGERVIIDRYDGNEPYFKVTTFQNNDWIRVNYFYKNGNVDEIYER